MPKERNFSTKREYLDNNSVTGSNLIPDSSGWPKSCAFPEFQLIGDSRIMRLTKGEKNSFFVPCLGKKSGHGISSQSSQSGDFFGVEKQMHVNVH